MGGQVCECFNGVAECSAPKDNTTYLNPMQAGFVAASGCVFFFVLIVVCLRLYFARKEARTLPIEGKRRSLVFSSSADYVTSKSRTEVELPAPPSAGGASVAYPPLPD